MSIKVVCNAKLDMTDYEYRLYKKICESYDDVSLKGSDLFFDLFESDDNGIITVLKPPSKRATTMEVYLFLVALMVQQHIRIMHGQTEDLADQFKKKIKEYDKKLLQIDEKLAKLEVKSG